MLRLSSPRFRALTNLWGDVSGSAQSGGEHSDTLLARTAKEIT